MPNRKGEPPNRSKAVKKRSYASRTPQARSYKTPGRVSESGMALGTVARTAFKMARKYDAKPPSQGKTIGSSISGGVVPRTKATAKYESRVKKMQKQGRKEFIKKGVLKVPDPGFKSPGPVATRMAKAPVKGNRKTGSKPKVKTTRTRNSPRKDVPGRYFTSSRWKR